VAVRVLINLWLFKTAQPANSPAELRNPFFARRVQSSYGESTISYFDVPSRRPKIGRVDARFGSVGLLPTIRSEQQ
jgi:hypothetical protein